MICSLEGRLKGISTGIFKKDMTEEARLHLGFESQEAFQPVEGGVGGSR